MKHIEFQYFINISNLDEAKQLYKQLAKQYHPDRGGDVEIMKIVNHEYELICKILSKQSNKTEEEQEKDFEISQVFKEAIKDIIHIEDLKIELVGTWIWVTGNTYSHREILKASKFLFAKNKGAWFFRTEDCKSKNFHPMDLDEIKRKYGSQNIKQNKEGQKVLQSI